MRVVGLGIGAVLLAGSASPSWAQHTGVESVEFPTSGDAAAQVHFREGVAAIHNFWWEEARVHFGEAQRLDPDFAMAYWGEAMSWYYPWNFGQNRVDNIRSVLDRLGDTPQARLAKAPTERERDYLRTLDVLIADGTNESRRRAFADEMRALATQYPDDLEAQAFLAFSLFGAVKQIRSDPDVQDEAERAAQRVLERYPLHPGALHYTIHALDAPATAHRALAAAERYDSLGPAAPHAIHMPSHIYVQLGRWKDVERVNSTAFRVSDEYVREHDQSLEGRDYHAAGWLPYARLQMGQYAKAKEMLRVLEEAVEETGSRNIGWYYAQFAAQHVIESRQWTTEPLPRSGFNNRTEYLGVALNAIHTGDLATAEETLTSVRDVTEQTRERSGPDALATLQWSVTQFEIEAALAMQDGDGDAAVAALREAVTLLDGMDPPNELPDPIKPPEEMLGEVLLELNRPEEALAAFEFALSRQAGRAASLLGVARTHVAMGHEEDARRSYRRLLEQWTDADSGIPALDEVRQATSDAPSIPGSLLLLHRHRPDHSSHLMQHTQVRVVTSDRKDHGKSLSGLK